MKELVIPDAAHRDNNSIEMMRVWIAERSLHVSLNVGMYKDRPNVSESKAWAIILADALRHIANALADEAGVSSLDVAQDLRAKMDAELDRPTSKHSGSFVKRN